MNQSIWRLIILLANVYHVLLPRIDQDFKNEMDGNNDSQLTIEQLKVSRASNKNRNNPC